LFDRFGEKYFFDTIQEAVDTYLTIPAADRQAEPT
jgi:hypothetical protein